jgi:hypothetical protein
MKLAYLTNQVYKLSRNFLFLFYSASPAHERIFLYFKKIYTYRGLPIYFLF